MMDDYYVAITIGSLLFFCAVMQLFMGCVFVIFFVFASCTTMGCHNEKYCYLVVLKWNVLSLKRSDCMFA
jgi:hypothetical protein